jgi:hypothetical protein
MVRSKAVFLTLFLVHCIVRGAFSNYKLALALFTTLHQKEFYENVKNKIKNRRSTACYEFYEKQHPGPPFGKAKLKRWCFIYGCRKTEIELIGKKSERESFSWTWIYFVCAPRTLFAILFDCEWINLIGQVPRRNAFSISRYNELRPKVSAQGGAKYKVLGGNFLNRKYISDSFSWRIANT